MKWTEIAKMLNNKESFSEALYRDYKACCITNGSGEGYKPTVRIEFNDANGKRFDIDMVIVGYNFGKPIIEATHHVVLNQQYDIIDKPYSYRDQRAHNYRSYLSE